MTSPARTAGDASWGRGGVQVGRCACGCTPAFGRAVRAVGPGFYARLKPCPSGSWWAEDEGRERGELECEDSLVAMCAMNVAPGLLL